jgi:hypothetical protein
MMKVMVWNFVSDKSQVYDYAHSYYVSFGLTGPDIIIASGVELSLQSSSYVVQNMATGVLCELASQRQEDCLWPHHLMWHDMFLQTSIQSMK